LSVSKYHARATTLDGLRFDSKAEAFRYTQLTLLARAGQITDLCVHPRYIIWDHWTVTAKGKKHLEKIEYEGDFSYTENGQPVVEDVKGVLTDVYRIKKKMFLARYPEIKFVELEV
jgi:hypothetical protein